MFLYRLFLYRNLNFKVPKIIRLNATPYFLNRKEFQQLALDHLSDNDFKDFLKLYKNYTEEPY